MNVIPDLQPLNLADHERRILPRIERLGGLNDLEEKTLDEVIQFFAELKTKFGDDSKLRWSGGWRNQNTTSHSWVLEYYTPETDEELRDRIVAAQSADETRRKILDQREARERAQYEALKAKFEPAASPAVYDPINYPEGAAAADAFLAEKFPG